MLYQENKHYIKTRLAPSFIDNYLWYEEKKMKRKKQYMKCLRYLSEVQLEGLSKLDVRCDFDVAAFISNYWLDVYWRNRNKLGYYMLNEVCEANLYESLPVRRVRLLR